MTAHTQAAEKRELDRQRIGLLEQVTCFTDKVMVVLAFVWIGLMILDFIGKLGHSLQLLNYAIWALFGVDFLVKLVIAPRKLDYFRRNWPTVLALVLPAFRVLRIFQALRALQAVSLLRILTTLNRAMAATGKALGKRGIGYVVALTVLVLFAGAAGMYAFENPDTLQKEGYMLVPPATGLTSYGDAVWWTGMVLTTIGSQYWPVSTGGRVLCGLISLYAIGVLGYITAAIASLLVGRDKAEKSHARKTHD